MTLHEKQSLFTENVMHLIGFIYSSGYTATLGEAYRTQEQADIYAKEGKGIKGSLHIKRLAIDINLFDQLGNFLTDKKSYESFGQYWKSLHPLNRWGGDFVALYGGKIDDADHFEMKDS